jgi:hypothetical protein
MEEFIKALALDLNKPRQECITAEIDNTVADALKASCHTFCPPHPSPVHPPPPSPQAEAALVSWAAPQRPSVDAVNIMDGCQIQAQPYGERT